MSNLSDVAVKTAFNRRLEVIKTEIESGGVTFYNPPRAWTKELLRMTALNYLVSIIAEESKWN